MNSTFCRRANARKGNTKSGDKIQGSLTNNGQGIVGHGRQDRVVGQQGAGRPERGSYLNTIIKNQGLDDAWSAMEVMMNNNDYPDKFTVSRMIARTVRQRLTRASLPSVYRGLNLCLRFIEKECDVDEVLFNAMLDTCCRLKDIGQLELTMERMAACDVKPTAVTLGILVKTYGKSRDLAKVLQVWEDMKEQRRQANDVTFGCMIDACVTCGDQSKALEVFEELKLQGRHRNVCFYTTLIKGFGFERDLPKAMQLFHEMKQERVPYNTICFNSLIDVCVKCEDMATAEMVLAEMVNINRYNKKVTPDLITFSTIMKGHCHCLDLGKALAYFQDIKMRNIRPDEMLFNTLMDGCARAGELHFCEQFLEEMMMSGLKPSQISHSIVHRLFQRVCGPEEGNARVAALYQRLGVDRPFLGAAQQQALRPRPVRHMNDFNRETQHNFQKPGNVTPDAPPSVSTQDMSLSLPGSPSTTSVGSEHSSYFQAPMPPMMQPHSQVMVPYQNTCPPMPPTMEPEVMQVDNTQPQEHGMMTMQMDACYNNYFGPSTCAGPDVQFMGTPQQQQGMAQWPQIMGTMTYEGAPYWLVWVPAKCG